MNFGRSSVENKFNKREKMKTISKSAFIGKHAKGVRHEEFCCSQAKSQLVKVIVKIE